MILHLDTSFLIDLVRERARDIDGSASGFLEDHLDDELRASLFVACELFLGVERSDRSEQERRRVEKVLSVVPWSSRPPAWGRSTAVSWRASSAEER